MASKLLETCEREFEHLFKNACKIPNTGMAETPVIGGIFLTWADHSHLLPSVCRALIARERFAQDVPGWPVLPLHEDDIKAAVDDDDCLPYKLVGYYGRSLARADWSYDEHPRFDHYVCGLMAYRHTPDRIRNDRDLQREFPPSPLTGLTDGKLYWRSPEQIMEDRQYGAWVNEMHGRRAPMQALDVWVREQVPLYVGTC
jgi:hypothetical protein